MAGQPALTPFLCSNLSIQFTQRCNVIVSFIPTFTLHRLEEEHMIIARKKKHNSQIYNLFINEDNLLVSVNLDLENLKISFFNLLDKTREKFGEKGPIPEQ
jgi:hypothetical protein